jgi:DNA helicase II / ATP-dependent DNA helicase PcrA
MSASRGPSAAPSSFAQNRRIHNQWQNSLPSRFIDELPEAHVEVDPVGERNGCMCG